MAYVDLNPVRAGIASTPEDSAFTSIYERIRRLKRVPSEGEADTIASSLALQSFSDEGAGPVRIPYSFKEYLQLVDWSARAMRKGVAVPGLGYPVFQRRWRESNSLSVAGSWLAI